MVSPNEVTKPVKKLIDLIGSEYAHEFVPVVPELEAKVGNCYVNVAHKVAKDGGNLVYGWAVWLGEFICEGEHHAVWEDQNGNLIDVTPHQVEADEVFFISDDRYTYKDTQIANIRVNVGNNPLVDHFILLSEMREFIKNQGVRVDDGYLFYNDYQKGLKTKYENLCTNVLIYLRAGGKLGSLCYCNSVKTYINCCGKGLQAKIEADKRGCATKSPL